ncbi:MAG: DUF2851 family protein [Chloroflexota bacterium]|nr:DUF2851 family protein [Chloroflexota bacterium]MDE2918593.1 DUF2851 family protein [Chloroflexota bacterium]
MQLWLDVASRVGPMRDSLGRWIEVVYPGRRTGLAGPDLQDAIVSIDGGPARRVDVEVHLHESSWEQHGHDGDARYAGDLLHLVWTAARRGSKRPPYILAPRALAGGQARGGRRTNTAGWPCWHIGGEPADRAEVRGVIRAEGAKQHAERAAVLESDIEALGADQALYRAVMRALGYSANTRQFEAVAEAAPIELLSALAGRSLTARRLRVEAELLGAAGLLPSQRGQQAEHPHVCALEEAWAYGPPRAAPVVEDWTLAAVRPHNRPARRLAGAARLLSTAPLARRSLAERVAGQVLAAYESERGRDLVGWFEVKVGPEDFWARHLDVGRPAARPLPALIGRGRSQDLLVNAVLPFTAGFGGWSGRPELVTAADAALAGLGAVGWNRHTRYMADTLRLERRGLGSALAQQGLLRMYRRWCRAKHCGECPAANAAVAIPVGAGVGE